MTPIKRKRYVILHRGNLYQFDDSGIEYMTERDAAIQRAGKLVDQHGGQAVLFQSLASIESSEMQWTIHEGDSE